MIRPDGIPQWALDTANDHIERGKYESMTIVLARAILKAKNDAYEEAAKAADGYRHKEAGFWSSEPDKSVYGWGTARREISQAIRNLKHETEV